MIPILDVGGWQRKLRVENRIWDNSTDHRVILLKWSVIYKFEFANAITYTIPHESIISRFEKFFLEKEMKMLNLINSLFQKQSTFKLVFETLFNFLT